VVNHPVDFTIPGWDHPWTEASFGRRMSLVLLGQSGYDHVDYGSAQAVITCVSVQLKGRGKGGSWTSGSRSSGGSGHDGMDLQG
jgi:hypothetical protein